MSLILIMCFLSGGAACQTAGTPRPLQIIAPAVAIHVQHLAAGIQAAHPSAFHGCRVKFGGDNAARAVTWALSMPSGSVSSASNCFASRAASAS